MEASLVEYVDAEHGIVVRHRLRPFEHVAVFHMCLCKVCVLVGSVNGGAAKFGRSAGSSTPVHTLHENRIGVSYSESVLVIVTTVEQGLYPVAHRRLSMP